MRGYQLTFFTQQDRKHGHQLLGEWLVEEADKLGIGGATMIAAMEGFGRDRKLRSACFFELVNQPVEITMAVSEPECKRLLQRLREEEINIFCIRAPIEFGMTNDFTEDC